MKPLSRAFLAAIIAAVLTLPTVPALSAAGNITIFIDGDELVCEVPPKIINDRTMVPVRAVTEAVGCGVDWAPETSQVKIFYEMGEVPYIVMTIGDPVVTVNRIDDTAKVVSEQVTIDSPPVIIDDRTLVPMRFIAEAIGYDVFWEEDTNSVHLYSPWYAEGGFELPDGIVYTEEYELPGDYGDGLSPYNAAMCVVEGYLYDQYVNFVAEGPVYITLKRLDFINGEECYIFDVYSDLNGYSSYGVGYGGKVYETANG